MKKILVPIDFSDNAMEALTASLNLAIKLNASIDVIHVYTPVLIEEIPDSIASLLTEQKQEEAIAAFIDYVKVSTAFTKFLDLIPMNFTLKEGYALDCILSYVSKENIDLVVMGTTGNSGLNKVFGNLAGEILENAKCPVLVVPKSSSFIGVVDKIGVGINYDFIKDKSLIDYAINWAESFEADIECFHVDLRNVGDYHDEINNLRNEFSYNRLGFYTIEEDTFINGVKSYYSQNSPNLIVLSSKKRNVFKELFHKNLAKEITKRLNIPILAFHEM